MTAMVYQCHECFGTNILEDFREGCYICKDCGLVVHEFLRLDDIDLSHVDYHQYNYGQCIGKCKLSKMINQRGGNKKLRNFECLIDHYCDNEVVRTSVLHVFNKFFLDENLKGNNMQHIAFALVWTSYNIYKFYYDPVFIAKNYDLDYEACYKLMQMYTKENYFEITLENQRVSDIRKWLQMFSEQYTIDISFVGSTICNYIHNQRSSKVIAAQIFAKYALPEHMLDTFCKLYRLNKSVIASFVL